MDGASGNIPPKWIIEFSDPIFGNRWTPDQLILTVQGRACNKKLITSQHDRRWLWSGNPDFLYNQAFYRGACNSSFPDMPKKTCPTKVPALPISSVTCDCGNDCKNGYCDCGTKQCMCNAGYFGPDCSQNTCESAGTYCGVHGKCVSKYLGGVLPVTQEACVCDAGWSGPTCEENPCAGNTCSGHGTCQAYDTDAKCVCDPFYFGANCEFRKDACMGQCPNNYLSRCGVGSGSTRMYQCKIDIVPKAYCNPPTNGGYQPVKQGTCCYHNCNACSMTFCPPAANDCYVAGKCQEGIPGIKDGTCTPQIQRSDGSRCNSVPFGICLGGQCTTNTSNVTLIISPTASRIPSTLVTSNPVIKADSLLPVSVTTIFQPTYKPTRSTTGKPIKATKTPTGQLITNAPTAVGTTNITQTPTMGFMGFAVEINKPSVKPIKVSNTKRNNNNNIPSNNPT